VPIPKKSPPWDISKDLHPISLTPIMSEIAEASDFVQNQENQFGAIPKSSASFALITDGNGATIRVVLFAKLLI
jgi:hypothetical protein